MKHYFSTKGLTEVYPLDLGSFKLYNAIEQELGMRDMQEIFNMPMWKSYYIDGKGRFAVVDNRNGKSQEYKIIQFVK